MSELTLFGHAANPAPAGVFEFDGQRVRVEMINGQPWFVLSDVAQILGYRDAHNASRILRANQKGYSEVSTPSGVQRMAVCTEPGLYRLLLKSNAANADAVQDWVTDEVLPAINRTGQYVPAPRLPQSLPEALRAYADQVELAEQRGRELEAARPAVEFHEQFVTADGLYKIGDVAKVLALPNMGQNKLFQFLRIQGVLIRSGESRNSPYQRHVELGRFVIKVATYPIGEDRTGTSKTTYATPKGLAYIADLIKQYGPSA